METILNYWSATFASFAIRNYRIFFIGQSVSLAGTWMQTVALGWLAYELTGSGSQLGIIVGVQFLPMLLFGLWGGLTADRFDKRTILYCTHGAYALVSVALGAFVLLDLVQVWMLYPLAVILGFIRLFDNPARQTIISELVGTSRLKNAISLNAIANNLARAIGPSVGGIIIAATSTGLCFLFNVFVYIFVIFLWRAMRISEMQRDMPTGRQKGQLLEGLRYIRSYALIRNLLIMVAVVGTFAYEFQISLAVLSEQTFNAGAEGYAALMTAFGVGAAAGGLLAARKQGEGTRQFLRFAILFGCGILATSAAPTLQIAIAGMLFVGFCSIHMLSLANSIIQLSSAPQMRGRVMSVWGMAMMGSTPVGGPIVGWVAEHAGARWGLAIGGIATLAVVAIAYAEIARRARAEERGSIHA